MFMGRVEIMVVTLSAASVKDLISVRDTGLDRRGDISSKPQPGEVLVPSSGIHRSSKDPKLRITQNKHAYLLSITRYHTREIIKGSFLLPGVICHLAVRLEHTSLARAVLWLLLRVR